MNFMKYNFLVIFSRADTQQLSLISLLHVMFDKNMTGLPTNFLTIPSKELAIVMALHIVNDA